MTQKLVVMLETGVLHIDLEAGQVPIKRLLGFAARSNCKRKFLLVSKILGKHYPVSPKLMSWSYRALARMIMNEGIPDSSLWIGMAETATGLGYGVFEYAYRAGLQGAFFMQTTRYHLQAVERLEFIESHSHATDFFLYYPDDPELRQRFLTARALVLIDDEISTGRTFLKLIEAYRRVNPHLKTVFIVSLVNVAHPDHKRFFESEAGVAVNWISLRHGVLEFSDYQDGFPDSPGINVLGNGACKKSLLAWPGRQGIAAPVTLDIKQLSDLTGLFSAPGNDKPILVLGTGECNAPAYLLGRVLEGQGYRVKVQSTSRSPIRIGNDIKQVCQFEDNYQDGIPNFLYNMDENDYREIIVCHETPFCKPISDRLHAWSAISARLEPCFDSTDAKLHFFRP